MDRCVKHCQKTRVFWLFVRSNQITVSRGPLLEPRYVRRWKQWDWCRNTDKGGGLVKCGNSVPRWAQWIVNPHPSIAVQEHTINSYALPHTLHHYRGLISPHCTTPNQNINTSACVLVKQCTVGLAVWKTSTRRTRTTLHPPPKCWCRAKIERKIAHAGQDHHIITVREEMAVERANRKCDWINSWYKTRFARGMAGGFPGSTAIKGGQHSATIWGVPHDITKKQTDLLLTTHWAACGHHFPHPLTLTSDSLIA
jgi:hypothetical protein